MLTIQKKRDMIEQLTNGNSINAISKNLGISKSTIYHHYKKINGRKVPEVQIPTDDAILGEFLGLFAGDGGFCVNPKTYNYKVRVHLHAQDDKDYANYVENLIQTNFKRRVFRHLSQPNGLTLIVNSKVIFSLIHDYLVLTPTKTYNVMLNNPLSTFSNQFLRYFVRGLIDTDGSVRKDGRIVLGLASEPLIKQSQFILHKFGIESNYSIWNRKLPNHNLHVLMISRKESIKYLKLIGFSNKRKEKKCDGGDFR